jgi:hypothetical protein
MLEILGLLLISLDAIVMANTGIVSRRMIAMRWWHA